MALTAPPADDPLFTTDLQARLQAPRSGRKPAVAVVVVGLLLLVFLLPKLIRVAPLHLGEARLLLRAVDDAGLTRPLLAGDALRPGEGVAPDILVVQPPAVGGEYLVAAVDKLGLVSWLRPTTNTCPVPLRRAGLSSDGVVAVPKGPGGFRVLLLKLSACHPELLTRLSKLSGEQLQKVALPDEVSIIDEVELGDPR